LHEFIISVRSMPRYAPKAMHEHNAFNIFRNCKLSK
jgi:hypothetical protein